jgi:hypothetical protein
MRKRNQGNLDTSVGQAGPRLYLAQGAWLAIAGMATDSTARLACFDTWAQGQQGGKVTLPLAARGIGI